MGRNIIILPFLFFVLFTSCEDEEEPLNDILLSGQWRAIELSINDTNYVGDSNVGMESVVFNFTEYQGVTNLDIVRTNNQVTVTNTAAWALTEEPNTMDIDYSNDITFLSTSLFRYIMAVLGGDLVENRKESFSITDYDDTKVVLEGVIEGKNCEILLELE